MCADWEEYFRLAPSHPDGNQVTRLAHDLQEYHQLFIDRLR